MVCFLPRTKCTTFVAVTFLSNTHSISKFGISEHILAGNEVSRFPSSRLLESSNPRQKQECKRGPIKARPDEEACKANKTSSQNIVHPSDDDPSELCTNHELSISSTYISVKHHLLTEP